MATNLQVHDSIGNIRSKVANWGKHRVQKVIFSKLYYY